MAESGLVMKASRVHAAVVLLHGSGAQTRWGNHSGLRDPTPLCRQDEDSYSKSAPQESSNPVKSIEETRGRTATPPTDPAIFAFVDALSERAERAGTAFPLIRVQATADAALTLAMSFVKSVMSRLTSPLRTSYKWRSLFSILDWQQLTMYSRWLNERIALLRQSCVPADR